MTGSKLRTLAYRSDPSRGRFLTLPVLTRADATSRPHTNPMQKHKAAQGMLDFEAAPLVRLMGNILSAPSASHARSYRTLASEMGDLYSKEPGADFCLIESLVAARIVFSRSELPQSMSS